MAEVKHTEAAPLKLRLSSPMVNSVVRKDLGVEKFSYSLVGIDITGGPQHLGAILVWGEGDEAQTRAEFILKACNAYAADQEKIAALVEVLNQCRTLISTVKHLDSVDRASLDAAVDLTMQKIDTALTLAEAAE